MPAKMSLIKSYLHNKMTDKVELSEFLYDKCREDRDLLANILDEYVDSLSDNKLIELEDFLVNNFGDD